MDCKKAESLINEFLDGTLSPAEAREFDRHVARCPACAREVAAYRSLGSLLSGMERESSPAGFAEPVIRYLRATGRIRETVPGASAERAATGFFGRIPGPARVAAIGAAIIVFIVTVVSISSGSFLGMVGKSAVAAKDVYIDAQQTISEVQVLEGVSKGLERDVRTAKTVADAVYLLISVAGQPYMIPALAMVLMITIAMGWYFRTTLKRSNENASYSF